MQILKIDNLESVDSNLSEIATFEFSRECKKVHIWETQQDAESVAAGGRAENPGYEFQVVIAGPGFAVEVYENQVRVGCLYTVD
jgi:hypothetical protein